MTTPVAASLSAPRVAAGALFVDDDRVLLVHKTYGNGWDIPGGYAERGESPAAACRREVREELGIDCRPRRLLVHDWAPGEREGDKLLYVFDCGPLRADRHAIELEPVELDRWDWVPVTELEAYAIPRLARRLDQAYRAASDGGTRYLEYGVPVLPTR